MNASGIYLKLASSDLRNTHLNLLLAPRAADAGSICL